MKWQFGMLLCAAAALGLGAQAPAPAPTQIEGLVRDVACPIQNHESTATNFNLQCALDCAKKGSPLIILTKSGEVYFPMSSQMPDTNQRAKLVPYVGKFVRATGQVYELNGTRTIAITSIQEMKDVHLNSKAFPK